MRLDLPRLRKNIVITVKALRVTLRRTGNSVGVVIPKPFLSQIHFGSEAAISIEGDALVLRKVASPPVLDGRLPQRKLQSMGMIAW